MNLPGLDEQLPGFGTHLITLIVLFTGSFILGYLFRFVMGRKRMPGAEWDLENRKLRAELEQLKSNTELSNGNLHLHLEDQLALVNRSNELLQQDLEYCQNERTRLQVKLEQTEKELGVATRQKVVEQPTATVGNSIRLDPLRRVEGIGPKIEELLHKHGILTFQILAATSVDQLREILHHASPGFGAHDPETWPQQAALAHEEKWEELDALQATLKGGRLE
ncbi:MAG: hypothetical protein H6606_04135 [Flavobacteriales bacterium]|nr:hypothetical protein [Flavobacteriales bacterium]